MCSGRPMEEGKSLKWARERGRRLPHDYKVGSRANSISDYGKGYKTQA